MDGGPSIGKPVVFGLDGDFTVDSHVAILRPNIEPRAVVYLLASSLGQIQFQRAESGASGQTSVTEEDVRRFRFPSLPADTFREVIERFDSERAEVARMRAELKKRERESLDQFQAELASEAITRP